MHKPDYWSTLATRVFKNRTIVDAFYMTKDEADDLGWGGRSVVLVLDDGSQIIPQSDNEGNDAGALSWANADKHHLLPVL